MPMRPAIVGTARLGNFRLGYLPTALVPLRATAVRVFIAGDLANARIRPSSVTIHDVVNDSPNTCALVVRETAPTAGDTLRVTINSDAPRLLFSGTIQRADVSYVGTPLNGAYPCTAIDDSAQVTRRRPFGTWTDVSATTIAQALIATFAPGFSAAFVEAGLPLITLTLDGTDDFLAACRRIATMIGGYFYVDDLALHLFQTETTDAPDPIDLSHPCVNDPPIRISRDLSQLRTRVFGKGHGEAVPIDVLAGETIVPLVDAVMFNPAGGRAIAGTTPDGAQSQILGYTGTILGGLGTIIGAGASPSVAPAAVLAAGSGLGLGVYGYAYVDVTPSGKSLPSPVQTVATVAGETISDPTVAPTAALMGFGILTGTGPDYNATGPATEPHIGNTVQYAYSWSTSTNPLDLSKGTALSPGSNVLSIVRYDPYFVAYGITAATFPAVTVPANADSRIKHIHIWRKRNGAASWLWVGYAINGDGTGGWSTFDSSLDGATTPPTPNPVTLERKQVTVTGIALGGGATTSREVYRTAVQTTVAAALTAQLKLLTTIANNTSTGPYLDSTADGSLGANVPTSDTSGLVQTFGQVNAGSTSLPVAGTAPLAPSGWVVAPTGDVVRYTAIVGNTLTGIPASGVGAILTSLFYGQQVVAAPALTGVTGLTLGMLKGTRVSIWVQRDDLAAQALQSTIDAANGRVPADGIYEGPPIVDERRGEASLIALCDATLAKFSRPIATVTYDTLDVKTKSGKPVVIDLAALPIDETLTIQEVTITKIGSVRGPLFRVTASSVRFSLEHFLRQMAAALGA